MARSVRQEPRECPYITFEGPFLTIGESSPQFRVTGENEAEDRGSFKTVDFPSFASVGHQ